MGAINGSLCVLKKGATLLTGQLDGDIGGSSDMLDATTKDSTGRAKEFKPGETTWDGKITQLYDPASSANLALIITDFAAGTAWTIKCGVTSTGGEYYTGVANIKSWNWNAPKNALSQVTLEVQGTAILTKGTGAI